MLKAAITDTLYSVAQSALALSYKAGPRRQRASLRMALVPVVARHAGIGPDDARDIVLHVLEATDLESSSISRRAHLLAQAITDVITSGPFSDSAST